jgi:flagellar motor protein MotB
MRRREGGSAWIITFADLMTLMFCFFVLLTVLSTQPKNCNGLEKFMTENAGIFKNYQLRSTKLSCIISLPQDFLFRSGDAELKAGAIRVLTPFFKKIRDLPEHQGDLVIVEGHADNLPIRTDKYPSNWELSTARATNVATMLINKMGYPSGTISVNGYSDTRPRVSYKDSSDNPLRDTALEVARRTNRRVEIVLTTPPKSMAEASLLFDGNQ